MPQELSEQDGGNPKGGEKQDNSANSEEQKSQIASFIKAIKTISNEEDANEKKKHWFRKLKWIEILGFFFVVVQTGIFIQQCSISADQSTYTEKRDSITDAQSLAIESIRRIQSDSLAAFSKRQAAATESLFVAARKSAEAAQQGVTITEKALIGASRALVNVVFPKLIIKTDSNSLLFMDRGKSNVIVSAVFKNSGRYPAIRFRETAKITVMPFAIIPYDSLGIVRKKIEKTMYEFVISSEDTIHSARFFALDSSEFKSLMGRKSYLFFYGTARYRDNSDNKEKGLDFCFQYLFDAKAFYPCDGHNKVW